MHRIALLCLILPVCAQGYAIPVRLAGVSAVVNRDQMQDSVLVDGGLGALIPGVHQSPGIDASSAGVMVASPTVSQAASAVTFSYTTSFLPTAEAIKSNAVLAIDTPPISSSASASVSVSSPEATPLGDGPQKYVVAHHIVGNTYPYTKQDWADDITLAHASGIDGFALNIGTDTWQPARVADAYQAAEESGVDFWIFLSLDMSVFPCTSVEDGQAIRHFVSNYTSHPNQLQYLGRAFVSTFSGESCTFGQGSAAEGWTSQFTRHPTLDGKIFFVPSFFVDPKDFESFAEVMDGDFNWNSGWPTSLTTAYIENLLSTSKNLTSNAVTSALSSAGPEMGGNNSTVLSIALSETGMQETIGNFIGSFDSDEQHLSVLRAISNITASSNGSAPSTKIYMGAASPWFYTHYGADSYNKNFIFLSDQHLYAKRWESLISSRDQLDLVEVLTWNDYGESHYVGPVKGSQPNSEAWVNGMEHTGWLELTQYYSTAYKTGQYPEIQQDKLFMWSRPHTSSAVSSSDPVGKPANYVLSEDTVWAVVMAKAPSIVMLATSPSNSQTFNVPAGLSKLSIPINPGGFMKGLIQRDGQTLLELSPQNFTFQGSPISCYNYNAFVASASSS